MPKKKKKKSIIPAKLQSAFQFKDFKKRLLLLAEACDAEAAYKTIPNSELKLLFKCCPRPFDVVAADGERMSAKAHREIKKIAIRQLKHDAISFVEGKPTINLYDYLYVGNFFRAVIESYQETRLSAQKFKGIDGVVDAFKPLLDKHNSLKSSNVRLAISALTLSKMLSRHDSGYCSMEVHVIEMIMPNPQFRTCFKVHQIPRQVRHLVINGKRRPAYRIGWTIFRKSFVWAAVTPQQLGIHSTDKEDEIPVYIQSHALRRLEERLHPMGVGVINIYLFYTFEKWDVVKGAGGKLLLSFYAGTAKLGYLVYEYVAGVMLIKTFLLLTNNGTPEGRKLFNILHLQINDRKYLHLDKLSHFMKSDIPENAALYNKFKEAGCDSLFDADEAHIYNHVDENIHARLIEDYIHPLEEEEESERC